MLSSIQADANSPIQNLKYMEMELIVSMIIFLLNHSLNELFRIKEPIA